MNRQSKSVLASFFIHGALIGLCVTLCSSSTHTKAPVLIDFSLLGSRGAEPSGPEKTEKMSRQEIPRPRIAEKHDRPVVEKPRTEKITPIPLNPLPIPASQLTGIVPVAAPAGSMVRRLGQETGDAGSNVGTIRTGSAAGTGVGAGSGTGNSAEQMKNRYLREQYEYIKDLIQNNVSYPQRAIRMGWTGRVVVHFVILENGRVADTRIVSSSGYDLLDENVIETIRSVEPFPRPPARAELKIPITYRLH
jgi:protein TonB